MTKAGLHRSPHTSAYDIPCYAGLLTKSAMVMDKEKWLPIKTVLGGLSFVRFKAGWGNALRRSFRQIKPSDAEVILKGMERLNPDLDWRPIHEKARLGPMEQTGQK